jgi:hypothetical protein
MCSLVLVNDSNDQASYRIDRLSDIATPAVSRIQSSSSSICLSASQCWALSRVRYPHSRRTAGRPCLPSWASLAYAQSSSPPAAAVSLPTRTPLRELASDISLTARSKDSIYDPVLADSEREAVADLLGFLENVHPLCRLPCLLCP